MATIVASQKSHTLGTVAHHKSFSAADKVLSYGIYIIYNHIMNIYLLRPLRRIMQYMKKESEHGDSIYLRELNKYCPTGINIIPL
jgi:hypothetical protein